jgi:hypothetical protein
MLLGGVFSDIYKLEVIKYSFPMRLLSHSASLARFSEGFEVALLADLGVESSVRLVIAVKVLR